MTEKCIMEQKMSKKSKKKLSSMAKAKS